MPNANLHEIRQTVRLHKRLTVVAAAAMLAPLGLRLQANRQGGFEIVQAKAMTLAPMVARPVVTGDVGRGKATRRS